MATHESEFNLQEPEWIVEQQAYRPREKDDTRSEEEVEADVFLLSSDRESSEDDANDQEIISEYGVLCRTVSDEEMELERRMEEEIERQAMFEEMRVLMKGSYTFEWVHFPSGSRGWDWRVREVLEKQPDDTYQVVRKPVYERIQRESREVEMIKIDGTTYTIEEDHATRHPKDATKTPLDKLGQVLFPDDQDMWDESKIIEFIRYMADQQERLKERKRRQVN